MVGERSFCTIKTLINRNAALYPDKIAMKEFETGKACTFKALKDRANRTGNALCAMGLKKGDRVGILSQNSFEYMEAILSVPSAGFIFVPVNFRLAAREMTGVLSDAMPLVLFVDHQYIKTVEQIKNSISFVKFVYIGPKEEKPEGWYDYEELIKNASSAEENADVFEDDIAMLMYTSGTTGLPKGVMQTHLNIYHQGRTCAFNNHIETGDVGFTICPMYHVTATSSFFGPFYKGATSILFQKWDAETFFRAAQEERLVAGMLATPMVRMLLDTWQTFKDTYDISSMKKLWFAGAGIIPSVYKQFIDTFGCILGEHHGTTETTGVTTNLSAKDIAGELARGNLKILESCGRDAYDCEIVIVDENDKPVVPPGTGEMKARGLGTSRGYWRKEEQTKKAFRDGWFYTEDICAIDEKGYVYVIDRKKDMIITGGENVYPAEIERVLNEHPSVLESSAIGVPHPVWGEAIAAVVVLKNDKETTEEDIIQYCKGKIAGYKVPKLVYYLPEMPRNPAGKISKPELRKQFASK
ncbi:MAG: AMP-binding protein [Proteobacteria bacterium]|nr:AMP-binding protein [Pseudomonadota bacterium]